MKNKLLYIIGLFLIVSLIGCDMRTYDVPEIDTAKYEPTSEHITIAQLKTLVEPNILGRNTSETNNNFGYLQDPSQKDVLDGNGNRYIKSCADINIKDKHLKAYVVGNDESGNIYKQVYLQDETGSILVIVNQTGLFTKFPIGQEVIVELDNLCVGKYYGAYQLGEPKLYKSISSKGAVNYGMNRLTDRYFLTSVYKNGKPDPEKAVSLMKTYTSIPVSTESVRNTLVRFENVSFQNGGSSQFAPMVGGEPATGTVKLLVNGKTIDVRTSGYANFAADTTPTGTGTVTAILSQYFETLQITIRGRNDLLFENE